MRFLKRIWHALTGQTQKPAAPPQPEERWFTVYEFLQEQGIDCSPKKRQGFGVSANSLCRRRHIVPRMAMQRHIYPDGRDHYIPTRSYPESVLIATLDHLTKPKEVKPQTRKRTRRNTSKSIKKSEA